MTEITDLSPTDSSNTAVTGESIDGAIANMGRMDNTLQAILGLMARSIRTNVMRFLDNTDDTKRVALDLSGLPTATTRTWTAPYYSGTLGLVSDIIGYARGLEVARNGTDPTNDVDMAGGSAVDSTGAVSIVLPVGLTKRVDATWVAGTGNGGRFYTTLVDGPIYLYLIRNPTTFVVDWGYSDNATTPTGGASYPAGFTQFVKVAALTRAGGVNGNPSWTDGRQQVGSWTPSIGGTATYTAQEGRYIKVGKLVYLTGRLVVNVVGTGSGTTIGGVPFPAASAGVTFYGVSINFFQNLSTNVVSTAGLINAGSSAVSIYSLVAAGTGMTLTNVIGTGSIIVFTAVYEAAT